MFLFDDVIMKCEQEGENDEMICDFVALAFNIIFLYEIVPYLNLSRFKKESYDIVHRQLFFVKLITKS